MALVSTTIAAGISATDKTFNLTSGTSAAVGRILRVNDEFMQIQEFTSPKVTVQRGKWGTLARAHGILSIAVHGDPADFSLEGKKRPGPQIYTWGGSADAIKPVPGLHRLSYASAGAYTLAAPSADMEGEEFTFVATTAAAHVITLDSGYWNGATNTIATWGAAIGNVLKVVVVGGSYCVTVNKNITLS
jgi:hypothetical protein